MRAYHILLAFVIISLLYCCSNGHTAGPGPNNTPSEIMPLKQGNIWVWKVSYYTYTVATPEIYFDTLLIYRTAVEEPGAVLNFASRSLENDTVVLINKSNGLYIRQSDTNTYLLYKYTASVNDSFPSNTSEITKVFSVDTTASCALGGFKCYGYLADQFLKVGENRTYAYVRPGIGLIRSYFYTPYTDTPSQWPNLYLAITRELVYKNF